MDKYKNLTAIIPARIASSRLPKKVLADIHGKPMIIRVVERVQLAGINKIYVATDSPEVMKICAENNVHSIITDDVATGTDRVVSAVSKLGLADNELVLNVQGDEPLLDLEIITKLSQGLITAVENNIYCATAIGKIVEFADLANPNVVKCVINNNNEALYFSRAPIVWARNEFPLAENSNPTQQWQELLNNGYCAYRHYGVYAFQVGFLKNFPNLPSSELEKWECLEQLRILSAGYKMLSVKVECSPKPAVDTPADLEKVRKLWQEINQ